ncbi:MAG: hypothetical protein OEZ06_30600 [Myxococcales bacterium]|nr:hypothetical protein [Myxococcales bacterium]
MEASITATRLLLFPLFACAGAEPEVLVSVLANSDSGGCGYWDPNLWAVFRVSTTPDIVPEQLFASEAQGLDQVRLVLENAEGGCRSPDRLEFAANSRGRVGSAGRYGAEVVAELLRGAVAVRWAR